MLRTRQEHLKRLRIHQALQHTTRKTRIASVHQTRRERIIARQLRTESHQFLHSTLVKQSSRGLSQQATHTLFILLGRAFDLGTTRPTLGLKKFALT